MYGQTVSKNHYGRIEVTFTKEKRAKKISTHVEIKYAFPGGDSAWVRSVKESIDQSMAAGKRVKKGTYMVSAKFIISRDGSLSDVVCESDPGFGMCEAVLRAIKRSKKWTAAEPVKVKIIGEPNQ